MMVYNILDPTAVGTEALSVCSRKGALGGPSQHSITLFAIRLRKRDGVPVWHHVYLTGADPRFGGGFHCQPDAVEAAEQYDRPLLADLHDGLEVTSCDTNAIFNWLADNKGLRLAGPTSYDAAPLPTSPTFELIAVAKAPEMKIQYYIYESEGDKILDTYLARSKRQARYLLQLLQVAQPSRHYHMEATHELTRERRQHDIHAAMREGRMGDAANLSARLPHGRSQEG